VLPFSMITNPSQVLSFSMSVYTTSRERTTLWRERAAAGQRGCMSDALAYVAATLTAVWGVAHVLPTSQVLAGFEPITVDNRRMLLQEWVAEAVTMWGLAALVITATIVDGGSSVTAWVYRLVAAVLVVLAGLTAMTGARTKIVWFRVCVALLFVSAVLLVVASVSG